MADGRRRCPTPAVRVVTSDARRRRLRTSTASTRRRLERPPARRRRPALDVAAPGARRRGRDRRRAGRRDDGRRGDAAGHRPRAGAVLGVWTGDCAPSWLVRARRACRRRPRRLAGPRRRRASTAASTPCDRLGAGGDRGPRRAVHPTPSATSSAPPTSTLVAAGVGGAVGRGHHDVGHARPRPAGARSRATLARRGVELRSVAARAPRCDERYFSHRAAATGAASVARRRGRAVSVDPSAVAERVAEPRGRRIAAVAAGRDVDRCWPSPRASVPTPWPRRPRAGLRDIGENYAQELLAKRDADRRAAGVGVHFIGRLQTNKVRPLGRLVDVWQSVDRPALVDEIARRAPGRPRARAGQRDRRAGQGRLPARRRRRRSSSGPSTPVSTSRADGGRADRGRPGADARRRSVAVVALADELGLPECSMGMTADLEVAVEEGATEVRIWHRAVRGPSRAPR